MKSLFLSLLMMCLTTAPALAAEPPPTPLKNVELKWKATTDLKDLVAANLGSLTGTVTIMKFKDSRSIDPKNKIGENKENEDKGLVLPVTTTSDVAEFVTDNLKEVLRKSGLEVVPSGGKYTLNGDITDYFVSEVNTYQGNLIVKFTLTKGNTVVWKNTVIGTDKRFGRSYKLENYMECLSDTVVDLATKLAQIPEFKATLK